MVSGRKEDDKQLTKISHPTREVEQSLNTKKQIETAKLVPQKSFLTMIDGKVYNHTNLFKVFVTQKALCAINSCGFFQNKAKR